MENVTPGFTVKLPKGEAGEKGKGKGQPERAGQGQMGRTNGSPGALNKLGNPTGTSKGD